MYGNVAQWLVVPSIRMSLGFESQLCYLFFMKDRIGQNYMIMHDHGNHE